MVGWMSYWSQRSETGVRSRRWSRRMAAFSWALGRFRVFLGMGEPPLEIVAYSSGPFFPFRLKQNISNRSHRLITAFQFSGGASGRQVSTAALIGTVPLNV